MPRPLSAFIVLYEPYSFDSGKVKEETQVEGRGIHSGVQRAVLARQTQPFWPKVFYGRCSIVAADCSLARIYC